MASSPWAVSVLPPSWLAWPWTSPTSLSSQPPSSAVWQRGSVLHDHLLTICHSERWTWEEESSRKDGWLIEAIAGDLKSLLGYWVLYFLRMKLRPSVLRYLSSPKKLKLVKTGPRGQHMLVTTLYPILQKGGAFPFLNQHTYVVSESIDENRWCLYGGGATTMDTMVQLR